MLTKLADAYEIVIPMYPVTATGLRSGDVSSHIQIVTPRVADDVLLGIVYHDLRIR